MLRNSGILLITAVMVISLSACSQTPDETAFKKAAMGLRPLLSGIANIKPKIINGPEDVLKYMREHEGTEGAPKEIVELLESKDSMGRENAKGISIVDYSPQKEFYDKNEQEWLEAAINLEDFCGQYPDSIWLDDAHVLLTCFAYADPADESRKMHNIAKRNMGIVTKEHNPLHLEKWTLRKFNHEFVESLNMFRRDLLRSDMSDNEVIYTMIKYGYGRILISDGDKEGSKSVFTELAEQFKGLPMEDLIRSDLDETPLMDTLRSNGKDN